MLNLFAAYVAAYYVSDEVRSLWFWIFVGIVCVTAIFGRPTK